MSLKAELETWAAALKAYDDGDFDKSLELFSTIADSSRILTNMGLIYATIGEHEAAVEQFLAATQLDQYLAVAYFQCGVSNFLLQRYDLAFRDFDGALLYLRGNENINYEQLGLKFKLYSAEVLFNKGLCKIYMDSPEEGMAIMAEARKEKMTDEHNVIDDAMADRGEGYTVFSIPVGILYRPSEAKLKNAKAKDYLGKAKLVAASDESDAYTTFTGVTRLKQGVSPAGVRLDDVPASGLSRAATVTVTSRPTVPDADRPQPSLQRAKTTINVPADARERIRAATSGPNSPASNPTSPARGPGESPVRALSPSGPGRSASMRRPGERAPPMPLNNASAPSSSRPSPRQDNNVRMTDFYDDYINSYGGPDEPPLPPVPGPAPSDRVANWARNNANPPPQRSRSMAPPSSYSPSSAGGTLRRKTTKRSNRAPRSTYYEEEEEGYASGDYEDGPYEMTKIRVKLHYQDDTRGMAIDAQMPFEEFIDRVTSKFGRSFEGLGMKFKDEDGGRVTLRDEMDYELAIETAKESAKGKPEGRLEIWCADV
ncbi:NADPH oxidase regulator NoxR [Phanerochaete sordida]|uniref:NADPH oxidase regulator NoxR n=1 Tax=Phanerochaete sordida TaxID=48140 RepID=A0A9P3GAV9_9APHY|nr:NADPH oxidase regulator NoxR [Phanerochaete sordida]